MDDQRSAERARISEKLDAFSRNGQHANQKVKNNKTEGRRWILGKGEGNLGARGSGLGAWEDARPYQNALWGEG